MYHISDLKKFTRCPRLYLYSKQEKKGQFQPFVRIDEELTLLATQKLGITDYFLGTVGDTNEISFAAMEKHDWLVKARFEADDLRIKVPFLHRVDGGYDIYFLFAGISPKANDIQFYVDTIWVLRQNHIKIRHMYLMHLNANYVRGDTLDPKELFTISSFFYNNNNNPTIPFQEEIEKKYVDLHPLLHSIRTCTWDNLPPQQRKPICAGRVKCQFYNDCFPQERIQEDNSILTLIASRYRYDMQKEGIKYLRDADLERIEGSRQQYAQIMADKNGGIFVDQYALKSWLDNIQYPIAFLDFEWERFAIPPYKGMKPYDVLPFEYALDILFEDGHVEHHVYLNIHDDRRDMAESLIREIPKVGSVVAYNAIGAEMVRLREFAEQFPDLKDDLMQIHDRMQDMQIPFISGAIYDVRMKGQWSLKVIMAMMNDPGYSNLDISQGMDAVYQWRHLDHEENMPREERQKIIEDLKKYCGMDAYAMVVVYQWLKSLIHIS